MYLFGTLDLHPPTATPILGQSPAAAALSAAAAAPRPRAGATKSIASTGVAPPAMITELGFTPLQLFAHVRLFPAESWEIHQHWYSLQRYLVLLYKDIHTLQM